MYLKKDVSEVSLIEAEKINKFYLFPDKFAIDGIFENENKYLDGSIERTFTKGKRTVKTYPDSTSKDKSSKDESM